MKINVLIRTGHRPESFQRALQSIEDQTHKDVRVIAACDTDTALIYVPDWVDKIRVFKKETYSQYSHYWNFYCNHLKQKVSEGWFFYLDDDDYLYDNKSLERIVEYLTESEKGVICQFIRNGKSKPSNRLIERGEIIKGRIGSPSLFLHASQKNIADWDGYRAADYRFIKEVASKISMKFVPIVVVQTGNNGLHGR